MRPRLGLLLLLASSCRGPGTQVITCPDGYTQCGSDCVDLQNDPSHCGSCDNMCPADQQCFSGTCMPRCPDGQHPCAGVCVSSSDVNTCGNRCTPCPVPDGGIATCDGMTCGAICGPTQRFCGGVCAHCPGAGGLMCAGTQCVGNGCPVGQHKCNGVCVDENGGSCGDTCLMCPAPPINGFQACINGGCEALCRAGYRVCAAGCCPAGVMEAGGYHSCQKTPAGGLLCWGRNHLDAGEGGQLGVGDYTDRSQSTPVLNATMNMSSVDPGMFHTCSIDNTGDVKCWGVAGLGRIGDGSTSDKLAPVQVSGLGMGSTIEVSSGGTGSCALSPDAKLKCWGDNTRGEVGDGTMTPRPTPTSVPDLGATVLDVSFGGSHACAIVSGGFVRCWGANDSGQLGDGSRMDRPRPVLVSGLSNVARLSTGESHTCAILKTGELYCWGDNSSGQLGAMTVNPSSPTPVKVAAVSNPTAVSAGGAHTCALLPTGQIQCWGANDSGQLGDGTMMGRPAPMPVSGITDGTTISCGHAHTCARTQSGTRCWGNNEFGQLGDGTTMNRPTPVIVN
jgi:alpha-tubulin suppressor-like RCC1 family protein